MSAKIVKSANVLLPGRSRKGVQRIQVRTPSLVYPKSSIQSGERPPILKHRIVTDLIGTWFEVGFSALNKLEGNAADGFSFGDVVMELQRSEDLQTWTMNGFEDCALTAIDNGNGTWDYWARSIVPIVWANILLDLRATSTRYGKSITGIKVMGVNVSLPNYPYAMPAQADQLQTDLRAAGYTGALVTSSPASISVDIKNHYLSPNQVYLAQRMAVIMSGSEVIEVSTIDGTIVNLPGFPYDMPADQSLLQADLRTAGFTGAVVMLHADEWDVLIINKETTFRDRGYEITVDPGDPNPYWNFFGQYVGEIPNNLVVGKPENIRSIEGEGVTEAEKAFARIRITRGRRESVIRKTVKTYR